eukprot:CAMPEP_0194348088 /NCGR_PEP_ID=MMETSP0171-20130528/106338_1 /TAXON_ID=218684 /ORGANISM="Corethron pennatum, Strain L29A3" /LENGTH=554 /DNA_ID=CAMNT_0039115399 /DNA_START=43 /DNA_END=1708 /DNA_ORIENTATION=-
MGKCDEECCGSQVDLSDEKYGKAATAATKEKWKLLQLALLVGVVTLTIILFQGKSGDSNVLHQQTSKFSEATSKIKDPSPANIWDVSAAKKEDKKKKDKNDNKEEKKTKKKEARKKVNVKTLEVAVMKLERHFKYQPSTMTSEVFSLSRHTNIAGDKYDEELCEPQDDSHDEKYGKAAAAATKARCKFVQGVLFVGVVTLTVILFQGESNNHSRVVHSMPLKLGEDPSPVNVWDVSGAKKLNKVEEKKDKNKNGEKDKNDNKEKKKNKDKEKKDKNKNEKNYKNDTKEIMEARKKVNVKTLEVAVMKLDTEVRSIKKSLPSGHFMETDPGALKVTKKLQDATRKLLAARYGPDYDDPAGDVYGGHHYRIKFDLAFQKSMPDYAANGASGSFTIEMAPTSIIPHSVFTFLEVARLFKRNAASGGFGTAFHRNADHVLQARVQVRGVTHLAFQEYDKRYPHKKYTLGYAGRPSGPEFYVSIQNNSGNHGPGSQQAANPNEADGNFGRVISGFDVVDRVHKMPGQGFIGRSDDVVGIQEMTIMVPSADGKYTVWKGA